MPREGGHRVYRHSLPVRLTHWINVLCLAILLMSGLQIFNAHPALYWGEASDFERPLLYIYNDRTESGRPVGLTWLFGSSFETTGVLGWSEVNGRPSPRAFPAWSTIPSGQDLTTRRVWLDLFGGRQSARTLHFVVGGTLVVFVVLHVAMVLLSGVLDKMRSMITGWYVVEERSS